MKKLLITAAAVLVGFFSTSNRAEAGIRVSIGTGYTYVSGYGSCGCPSYTKRVVRGYDYYNRPIFNYYRQPFRCSGGCRHSARRSGHSYGYRGHGYSQPRYVYSNRSHRNYSYRGDRRSNRGYYNNRRGRGSSCR